MRESSRGPIVSVMKSNGYYEGSRKALKPFEDDIAEGIQGKNKVLIKPNFVSTTVQLAATHVDTIKAVLDMLSEFYDGEIIIGEGPSGKSLKEAITNFGYDALIDEYHIKTVDLNGDKFVELEDWQRDLVLQRLSEEGTKITDLPQFKSVEKRITDWNSERRYAPNFIGAATLVDKWGADSIGERDFSNIGAVIGVTYPEEARILRKLMPHTLALGPGFGAQKANIDGIVALFNENGEGGVINNSRGTNFAYKEEPYKQKYKEEEHDKATREATENMRDKIVAALKEAKKSRW